MFNFKRSFFSLRRQGILLGFLCLMLSVSAELNAQNLFSGCVGACGPSHYSNSFTRTDAGTGVYAISGVSDLCEKYVLVIKVSGAVEKKIVANRGSYYHTINIPSGQSVSISMTYMLNPKWPPGGEWTRPTSAVMNFSFVKLLEISSQK